MRGKHVGPLLGFAPTGKQVEVHQVHIFRLNGDKVAEHREVWAELSLLVQLISERGRAPAIPQSPTYDRPLERPKIHEICIFPPCLLHNPWVT